MNIRSLQNLKENLETFNKSIFNIPLVLQYNKRDLEEEGIPILSVDTMQRDYEQPLESTEFCSKRC